MRVPTLYLHLMLKGMSICVGMYLHVVYYSCMDFWRRFSFKSYACPFTGGYGRFCAGNHRLATPTAGGSLHECGKGRPTRFHRPPEVSLRPDESVEAGRSTRFHRPPEVSLRPDESVEAGLLYSTVLQRFL
jgi:hypothetical protein